MTIYRWMWAFAPMLVDAARPDRDKSGGRWFIDEMHLEVAGVGRTCMGRWISTASLLTRSSRPAEAAPRLGDSSPSRCAAAGVPVMVVTDRRSVYPTACTRSCRRCSMQ